MPHDERWDATRTASQVLIDCMEQFANIEGKDVVVVFTDESGAVEVQCNCRRIKTIGMLRVAEDMVMREMK